MNIVSFTEPYDGVDTVCRFPPGARRMSGRAGPICLPRHGRFGLVVALTTEPHELPVGRGRHGLGERICEKDSDAAGQGAGGRQDALEEVEEGEAPEVGEVKLAARLHRGPEVEPPVEDEQVGHLVHEVRDDSGDQTQDRPDPHEDAREQARHHEGDEDAEPLEEVPDLRPAPPQGRSSCRP